MADKPWIPSAHDAEVLQRLLDRERQRRANPQQRPWYPEDDAKAPDVYVAKTTSALPALADHGTTGTGTGTGVEPGTGTADVYRADLNDYGERRLHAMGPSFTVYNLLSSEVSSGSWVIVERDKWGLWWTAQPALVSGGGSNGASSTSGLTFVGTYEATANITDGQTSPWSEARTVFTGLDVSSKYVMFGFIRVSLLLNSSNTEISESWVIATTSGSGTVVANQINENRVPTSNTVVVHTLTVASYVTPGGASDGIKITPSITLGTGTFFTSSVTYSLHLWKQ